MVSGTRVINEMEKHTAEPDLMTLGEAAEIIGITRAGVSRLRKRQPELFPPVAEIGDDGKTMFFPREELMENIARWADTDGHMPLTEFMELTELSESTVYRQRHNSFMPRIVRKKGNTQHSRNYVPRDQAEAFIRKWEDSWSRKDIADALGITMRALHGAYWSHGMPDPWWNGNSRLYDAVEIQIWLEETHGVEWEE